MLKTGTHSRTYSPLQKLIVNLKKSVSLKYVALFIATTSFNFNGLTRKRFAKITGQLQANFSRDTVELEAVEFIKIIDNLVFVNPTYIWAGSNRIRAYRQKCFDLGVADLGDLPEGFHSSVDVATGEIIVPDLDEYLAQFDEAQSTYQLGV
ncbi:MAG: hypothetical protein ACRC2V_17930 [Xenococcaceae cyanobacterium]